MNRQAIVGVFTILAFIGLFAIFAVLANVGTGNRYHLAVHFASASGIHKGALVYESGVNVGIVDSLRLLPADGYTVDVILALNNNVDIPKDARFIIQAPLTGDATLEIVPRPPEPGPQGVSAPTAAPAAVAIWPHEVNDVIDQQPQGTNPATLADLLDQGQGEIKRLDILLAALEKRAPGMLDTFQSALKNANEITITTNQSVQQLSKRMNALAETMQVAITAGSANVVDLTKQLDYLAHTDGAKADQLLSMLNTTAHALNDTVDSVRDLAKNPEMRKNLLDTTKSIAQTTETIASLTGDLRNVTGNPQTQAQLRDTVANVDAAAQKTNSLLATLGGKSSVYGVDRGATPAPVVSSLPRPSGGTGAPGPIASTGPDTPGDVPANFKSRIGAAARDLVAIQIRVSELSRQNLGTNSSPILSSDRGPQTDFNIIALPKGHTNLFTGVNDIGSSGTTTYNLAAMGSLGDGLKIGGGILYSRLGLLGSYTSKQGIGIEGRVYDLRRPTLDAYGNIRVANGASLFAGERDATRDGRRTVFGLQLQF
jgi:ABC-type transporter Mla subunit MlaD